MTRLRKRERTQPAVEVDERQLGLPIVSVSKVDPDFSPQPAGKAEVRVVGSVVELSLAKVLWKFDLKPEGAERVWPVRHALAVGVEATALSPVAKALPGAKGAQVEYGFMGPDLREYFLSGDSELAGVLQLKRAGDKWKAGMCKSLLPYVLTADAVAAGAMPPAGRSALPESLERVVPAKYAYWKIEDPQQAEATRNALVDSGLFEDRLIKVVDGALRLCIEQLFLYEPGEDNSTEKFEAPTLSKAIVEAMPAEVQKLAARTPLAEDDDWTKALNGEPACLVLSAPDAETFAHVVEVLSKNESQNPWIVEYVDSPDVRAQLWKLGRPFTVETDDAAQSVFVASYELVETPLVKWAESPVASAAETLSKRALRIAKTEKDGEERYVLGIVLEPETIDAQNDIYAQNEIRSTAHKFMEDYKTIGLMHKGSVNDKVKILESYIAPADFEVDGQVVKAGTWMLAVRVVDDELWKACKAGELTGFSIGGSAIRKPEGSAASA